MTTTHPPSTPRGTSASPAGLVAGVRGRLAELGEVIWAAKPPEDLLAVNVEIERLRSTLAAVQAQVAVEIDATGAQKAEEYASSADYLTAVSGGRRGHGNRLLHTAREVTGERNATGDALAAGEISPEQAEVIVRVIDKLPTDTELREVAEKYLLQAAEELNATELRTVGDRLLEVLDPEGTAKRDEKALDKMERSAHLNRYLAIVEDGIGGVRLRGRGTVEDAAVIKTALSSLSAPEPNTDPDCGLEGRDPRDHGARTWDALVGACQQLADAEVLPSSHGMKPRVVVTVDFESLRDGVGSGTLDTGDTLSAAAIRKLACDADVIPGVLGAHGEVLDVGRAQRLVTTVIWMALVLRDRHCVFPGCRRPPIACDAHHIVHWADGGATCLDNLAMLCRAHHTVIHNSGWQVRLNPHDRLPEFKPPPGRHRLDPDLQGRLHENDDQWVRERQARQ